MLTLPAFLYLPTIALHIVLCLSLVLIIILQPGKGGDVGAAFGGAGSSSMFGPRGPTTLLQRLTTGAVVMFMVTSVVLALFSQESMLHNSQVDVYLETDKRLADEDWDEREDEKKDGEDGGSEDEGDSAP